MPVGVILNAPTRPIPALLEAQIKPDPLGCLANGRNARKVCGRSVLAAALALVMVVRGRRPPIPHVVHGLQPPVCPDAVAALHLSPPKWLPNTPMIIVEDVYFSFPLHPTQKAETGPSLL